MREIISVNGMRSLLSPPLSPDPDGNASLLDRKPPVHPDNTASDAHQAPSFCILVLTLVFQSARLVARSPTPAGR
jgi:hypothetical protein